jgi:hypothetical protein
MVDGASSSRPRPRWRLAEEWQQAVDEGLGDQDLTVVTRVLEQQGGTS